MSPKYTNRVMYLHARTRTCITILCIPFDRRTRMMRISFLSVTQEKTLGVQKLYKPTRSFHSSKADYNSRRQSLNVSSFRLSLLTYFNIFILNFQGDLWCQKRKRARREESNRRRSSRRRSRSVWHDGVNILNNRIKKGSSPIV